MKSFADVKTLCTVPRETIPSSSSVFRNTFACDKQHNFSPDGLVLIIDNSIIPEREEDCKQEYSEYKKARIKNAHSQPAVPQR